MAFPFPDPGERPPRRPPTRPPSPSRSRRVLVPTVLVLGAIVVLFGMFADFFTELLWFRSVDAQSVFTTRLVTQVVLFVVTGLLVGAVVAANALLAYRLRPAFRVATDEQQSLDRYRDLLEPRMRLVVIALGLLVGGFVGAASSGRWKTFLTWRNGTEFGTVDPQFKLDISFYVFDYPWWRFVLGLAFTAVILSLIVSLATHYLFGGLRLQQPQGERSTPATQLHLSMLLGVLLLLKAVAYWFDRFGLMLSQHDLFTGASYADITAVLPAKTIMTIIAVICAGLLFASAFRRSWLLPGVGVGLLLLATILIGGVYPAIIQQFKVNPNQAELESQYIDRNIKATRTAFGFEDLAPTDYRAVTTAEAGQLLEDADSVPGIRLLDPNVVSPTFEQLQQVRGFYAFPETLDVDRYKVDGEEQDTVIAVREINIDGIPATQQNWLNQATVYTHGFGVVAARGNQRNADGSPLWSVEDIPPVGDLGDFEPRVYFGEESPPYSIVGAPEGTTPVEFDIPEGEEGDAIRNTYAGGGGVPMGGLFRKVLYAVKFQEGSLLLSERVNADSRVLYDREPRLRVQKVAPWLKVDGDPYPAIVDGKILWILDGYTTVDAYPYAQRIALDRATTDSVTSQSQSVVAQAQEQVNYVRNSVKATVDAYTGTVTLYEWDDADPVLATWMKVFPGMVVPRTEISPDLMAHLRYPQDLFKIQRELIAKYHVTDPQAWFSGQELWVLPDDPETPGSPQPPFYLSLRMPDQDAATFSLTSAFVPNKRQNLSAFMAVNADATDEDYGTFRVLQLPSSTQVDGPSQVANRFESNAAVAQQLTLLRQGGANVVLGNLLTLPVGGGLLYVQPVYVERQSGDTAYPLLRFVLAAFGGSDVVGFASTLQESLDQVFAGDAGASTGEQPGGGTPPPTTTPPPTDGTTPPPAELPTAENLVAAAQQAYADSQAALARQDFTAYGAALDRLKAALDQLAQVTGVTIAPTTPSG